MIKVWSDNLTAGLLGRHGQRGAAFTYASEACADRAVSMTMPVRLASWNQTFGLHPIFEMNLPEGYLRERLRLDFAKATGTFDDLDLLAIVGRSQIGRLRYTAPDEDLSEEVPFQAVDEILSSRRDGELFSYMMERFARHSGVAGVQPKVMIRDEANAQALEQGEGRLSLVKGATHIVKFWDQSEFPQLAANEFFCLLAAEKAGLPVPRRRLSDDGSALVIDRFDLRSDGAYMGVEDFCVLNAKSTARKYDGGYESNLFRRAKDYIPADLHRTEFEKLFSLFVLNAAVRNGDAHLKNFALVYDDVNGPARLSDIYDVVTTTAYLPKDGMALTLEGSTRWPNAKLLTKVGLLRCGLAPREVAAILERVATALDEASEEMRRYARDNPAFRDVAERMAAAWEEGISHSLLGA